MSRRKEDGTRRKLNEEGKDEEKEEGKKEERDERERRNKEATTGAEGNKTETRRTQEGTMNE